MIAPVARIFLMVTDRVLAASLPAADAQGMLIYAMLFCDLLGLWAGMALGE